MARILVADDSPDVRLALVSTLEDEGHVVIEAEDGDQVYADRIAAHVMSMWGTIHHHRWPD